MVLLPLVQADHRLYRPLEEGFVCLKKGFMWDRADG